MLRFNKEPPPLPEYRVHLHPPTKYSTKRRTVIGPSRFPILAWTRRLHSKPIRYTLTLLLLTLLYYFWKYSIHVEIQFFKRSWVRQEILHVERISSEAGCFNELKFEKEGWTYNISEALYGAKRTNVAPGIGMKLGMDCYDFAGTIPSLPSPSKDPDFFSIPSLSRDERMNYHTYWRSDLEPFGERQEWMLKSFFATQNVHRATLVLWSDDAEVLKKNLRIQVFLKAYPEAFELKTLDVERLARGTALRGSKKLKKSSMQDDKAWVDGDLARLLVIWNYGGVWVDMDSLLTRDLEPLLDHEFVTQWDCYDKMYSPMNGALMHFRKHSSYLCEAFHIMATSPSPKPGSTDWGSLLYLKLWRRLIASSIPPFSVLPSCFSEGRSCRLDNRLPDPFEKDPKSWADGRDLKEGGELDAVLGKIFVLHLHNQWKKAFPEGGWVDRLLLKKYNDNLPPSSA